MIEAAEHGDSTEQVIPHILRRAQDIERIIAVVVSQAACTRQQLGTGIPRSVHQLVLVNRLIHMGLTVDVEPRLTNVDLHQVQPRSVIAVNGQLLIECHAESDNKRLYQQRMKYDLNNTRYRTGLLIACDIPEGSDNVTRVISGHSLH